LVQPVALADAAPANAEIVGAALLAAGEQRGTAFGAEMLEAHAAVVTPLAVDLGGCPVIRTCPAEQITVTRYGDPVSVWQSVQWQIETSSGSISAS
jgi:hypothetical protein